MSLFLRITAVISLLWAVLLVPGQSIYLVGERATPLHQALGNGLGIASVVFAFMFWRAAADPPHERTTIYGAMLLLACKIANDLYELLGLLKGPEAFPSMIDLIASLALLVGMLQALPATLAAGRSESQKSAATE
ncbi:MAG TPA: hypothetical protein VMW17_14690 [Candidatus Binatia bacterium]|nr:hypothetical protein [Candidatus Binatia bacterium]